MLKLLGLALVLVTLVMLNVSFAAEEPDKLNWTATTEMSLSKKGVATPVASLSDQNHVTGIEVTQGETAEINVTFRGQVRHINRVIVMHSGNADFRLEGEDLRGALSSFDDLKASSRKEGSLIRTLLSFDDLRPALLRLHVDAVGPRAEVIVVEMTVGFRGDDTDDGNDECGSWWIEQYQGSDCGGSNSYGCDDIARKACERLWNDKGYSWSFDYDNEYVYEDDFRGDNNDFVDAVDLTMVAGTGSSGKFNFAEDHGGCALASHEVDDQIYGNTDMEWMCIHGGKVMNNESHQDNWHQSFDHLHLMCSWQTTCKSHASMGSSFANRLVDQAKEVDQSWRGAARASHGSSSGSKDYATFIIGETEECFEDHVWGVGNVSSDPNYNSTYWYQIDSFKGDKANPVEYFELDLVPLSNNNSRACGFKVPRDLALDSRGTLSELRVIHRLVAAYHAVDLADLLCAEGISELCGSTTGDVTYYPNSHMYGLHRGAHEIYVWERTGAWEYVQSETWLDFPGFQPTLMSDGLVIGAANNLLSSMGWLPTDATPYGPSGTVMGMDSDTSGAAVPDVTYWLDTRVGYDRVVNGLSVYGPGAYMEVTFGHEDTLQSLWCGGWRDVFTGSTVVTPTMSEALDQFALEGSSYALGGMPPCDTFLVASGELGYWEEWADSTVDFLTPVWLIDGHCVYTDAEFMVTDTTPWLLVLPATCCEIRGDADRNGTGPDIADLVYLVAYMFQGGAQPLCMREADIDGSNTMHPDIADLVYLVNYMFGGGPPPPPCD